MSPAFIVIPVVEEEVEDVAKEPMPSPPLLILSVLCVMFALLIGVCRLRKPLFANAACVTPLLLAPVPCPRRT